MVATSVDSIIAASVRGAAPWKSLFFLSVTFLILSPLIGEEPAFQTIRVRKLSRAELSAVRERATRGDADAQVILGLAYDGANPAFKQDEAEARRWYEAAAKQGNLDARFWLTGINSSQAKDVSVIRSTYLEIAKAGHIGGMNAYATLCADGGSQDFAAAMFWWKEAANAGSAEGTFNVGIMYLEGEGIPVSEREGVEWLRRAVKRGSIPSAPKLGAMAMMEKAHLKPGPESTHWLKMAAEAGDANSMLNLGMALFHARGTKTDYVEAYMWFTLATERGLVDGRMGLRSRMTTAQIGEAEKRAAVWGTNHSQ